MRRADRESVAMILALLAGVTGLLLTGRLQTALILAGGAAWIVLNFDRLGR